ncbi:MAG TPA: XrtA system polysaccharide deacetylase, partial [Planctomycetota bacterium]|nr:XrtA system polysaccharide deacetylase [Planctomycetota bacterium]
MTGAAAAATHALSVDVEEWFQVEALRPFVARADWPRLESRVEPAVRRLLDLLERRGVRATFPVLGWVAERRPRLVAEIAARGHEVACHGWDHELATRQAPAEFRADIVRARALLQEIAGAPVLGYRAPTWSIRAGNVWALRAVAEAGFAYDSSFRTCAAARRAGLPAVRGAAFFRCGIEGARDLVEFPASSVEVPGLPGLPIAGGGFLRLYPYAATAAFLRRSAPANVYLHPWELDPAHPRLASGVAAFRTYVGLGGFEAKLERLLAEFRFAPMA